MESSVPGVHCGTRLLTEDPRRSSPTAASSTLEIGYSRRLETSRSACPPTRRAGDWRPVAARLSGRKGRFVVCVKSRNFEKVTNHAKDIHRRALGGFGVTRCAIHGHLKV